MAYRELRKGDRVKITGPWSVLGSTGLQFVGKYAIVIHVRDKPTDRMGIHIHIDGDKANLIYHWCRQNLRALPRRKTSG
ncbi:hypothetical protein LCGC14_0600930 [marine sediment metagenome]|uniref:Uncharacterized protein n=1 Tax=marine sediment metagenome TaxID=412755 RepID=A0A0F9RUL7_9ZZZZ